MATFSSSCSRRAARPPCGRAALPGSCRRRSRWRGTARRTGRVRARGSGRGRCGSAQGREPRATRWPGRRGSRRRSCRPRRAARPGSWSQPHGWRGPACRAVRRHTCAGARGSPPRHGRRLARPARSCGPMRAPPTRPATSSRRRADRRAPAPPHCRGRRRPRGRARRDVRGRRGTRRSGPSRRRDLRGRRRALRERPRCRSLSVVRTFHGSSRTVSSQVRIQPASGFWSLLRSSLSTSRSAASRTFSGRSAFSTRDR